MSNYHRYHCLDCKEDHKPENMNHNEGSMLAVLKFKREIAALYPLAQEAGVWDFELRISYGHSAPFEFIVKHLEHHVVVMSEYRNRYYEPDGSEVVVEDEDDFNPNGTGFFGPPMD